jgi:hypothetical protein
MNIEQEIIDKGLTAPHITQRKIEDVINFEYYFTASQGAQKAINDSDSPCMTFTHPSLTTLTFCVLVLVDGFTVTGESACASPENFDAELGRKLARENAVNKIWKLEGYLLKQKLFESN